MPEILPHSSRLDEWLHRNFNANMEWMARTAEIRKRPANFNEKKYNAAWVALWKYPRPLPPKAGLISAYAQGKDYHFIYGNILKEWAGQVGGQHFIDSFPVAERELAFMAGLGFIGRNTMLINPEFGSAFFIGGILLNINIKNNDYENIINSANDNSNNCAKCRRCLDACPNEALSEDGFLDSNRCAAYLTIEHRGEFSEEQKGFAKGGIFGCDICQIVCPYNKKHLQNSEPYFSPNEREWKKRTIKGTPLERTGTKSLKRNQGNFLN